MLEAAAQGQADRVRTLIAQGAALESRDAQGNTPLLRATDGNHVAAARVLMEAGANVNAQNRMQDSAYLLAGAWGYDDVLRLTLERGADLKSTNRYGGTALIPACERGHVNTVDILLRAGVDPDHVNRLSWTGLLEAILLSYGGPRHQAIVRRLIEAGADVNLPDGQGVTPLAHARQRGQKETERLLLAAGAR
ncbi:ankyrin repeat family protein [Bordetella holmesii 30539]|uniref:Ankyrin repeat family protein n=1 Tax=Bordetella holmesii 1058 TaxID=1247648 RepID=A0ABN0S1A9_9BORD|nr:ankyrin repeat family protein [Bordetella holmesii 44057]EWM44080.1 ankyrin repeat family protein [Bordetella holmesii 41130]EWM46098.1 ankyrin repeat family protein [Bordetella holmesii 35009]EXF89159.1 ankyrin repeat family protein [Bordetella holmesii 30539]EXX95365.1 ankyrin repeat family protein [Bordetella holmesii 1058]